jgi:hypothetical protein
MKKFLLATNLALLFVLTFSHKTQAQLKQLTNLPTLYITTTNEIPVDSKDDWRAGSMSIAAPDGTAGAYSGAIEIRGRGNSTWAMPKKPYRLRLASKYKLLGMPSTERNWVLLANYADKTLMRNALAFEVSTFLGLPYTPPYRFVDVYLNNSYIGNYTLTDYIQVSPTRVNIDEMKVTDVTEPALTGGYFIEANGLADSEKSHFFTSRGMKFVIKSPEDDKIVAAQSEYISSYFQMIEDRLFSADFQDPEKGYLKYIDQASLINWYIGCELTGNNDAFWSTYMFKKRGDDKIYFGPMWDYDIAFNNDNRLGDATTKRMSTYANDPKIWIKRMLEDSNFKAALAKRWKELRGANIKSSLDATITNFAATLDQSEKKNFELWPVLNTVVYFEEKTTGTYAEHVEFLRTYVSKRIDYLDTQFTTGISDGNYVKIVNKNTGKVLASSGDKAVQKTYSDNDLSTQWSLTNQDVNGIKYYTITNRGTGKRLQSPGENRSDQLILSSEAVNTRQQWQFVPSPITDYYGIVTRSNTFAVDNNNQSSSELNPVVQSSKQIETNTSQNWAFTAVGTSSPLPVYISGLTAVFKQNLVELSWIVYDNKNGSHFEIERFSDNKLADYAALGTVPLTEAGIGKYTFEDKNPLPGTNYYRLKQVDLDQSFTYSSIVSVDNSSIAGLSLWPVPATDKTNISFLSPRKGEGSMELFNTNGMILKTIPLKVEEGSNQYLMDISNLSQGLYIIKVNYSNESSALKMMKVN